MIHQVRRVKCDEAKPHCLRCQKFGRACDGYAVPSSRQGVAIAILQPRIPSVSIYTPDVSIHNTEDESRYFQNFIDHSAKELSGLFDPDFWNRLVLQEAHVVPAIRHAAIAIGALNKSLESAPGPDLKVNVIQSIDRKHHEAAVLQYLKAIQALNSHISTSDSPQLRTALVACLLFVCFEEFQGSFTSSVRQTYGGLKILRSYYQGMPGSRPRIPPMSHTRGSLKVAIRGKIIEALDNQTSFDDISQDPATAVPLTKPLDEHIRQQDSDGTIDSVLAVSMCDRSIELERDIPVTTEANSSKDRQGRTILLPTRKCLLRPARDSTSQVNQTTASEGETESLGGELFMSPTLDSIRKYSPTLSSTSNGHSSTATPPLNDLSGILMSSASITTTTTPTSTCPPTPSPCHLPYSQLPCTTQAPIKDFTHSRKRSLSPRSPKPPSLHNDFFIEEILIRTFVRLDGQGLFFGTIPGIPPLIWDVQKTWHLPIPEAFPSFVCAHRCWDFLMDRALQFFRRVSYNRAYVPSSSDPPEQIAEELANYLDQLDAFATAFQPILDSAIGEGGSIVNPTALLVSVHHKVTVVTLSSLADNSEMVYDAYLVDFKYVVQTCAMLIAGRDRTQCPRKTRYTFEVGVIPPLHVVTTKCRDPAVRREAVNLLFASPRQEGMWDGVLTARIGKWIINCEEDGLEVPSPDSSRHSSASLASTARGKSSAGRVSDRNPPHVEDRRNNGGFEDGKSISYVVNEAIGMMLQDEVEHRNLDSRARSSPRATKGGNRKKRVVRSKPKKVVRQGWFVPEENRVRLKLVDFHIFDRYIKLLCQKALPGADGKAEERETVIAW